jgi:lysophospholipase L1-like esterase
MRRSLFALIAAAALVGCSSSGGMSGTGGNGSGGNGGGGGGGGGTGGGGGGGGGGAGGGGAGGGGAGGGGGGGGGAPGVGIVPPGATLGTYIVLGDSISDNGGTGPFFYDSLHTDLAAKWPALMYVHAAQAGAITDNYSDAMPAAAPLLASQIAGLGHSYPGDVLVTITIGGNDLNAHAIKAIGGMDSAVRAEFGTHLDAELGELATPGRLGSGKVYIVVANIYDFTDGQGDFATVKCALGANVSAASDQSVFSGWNAVAATSIANAGGTLYDMHASFDGHGYNNPDTTQVWYDRNSCIHPDALGHDAIRRSIYTIVTGEALP